MAYILPTVAYIYDNGHQFTELLNNNIFWMCQNHTLMNAIEDLANNEMMSLLSNENLT